MLFRSENHLILNVAKEASDVKVTEKENLTGLIAETDSNAKATEKESLTDLTAETTDLNVKVTVKENLSVAALSRVIL